jgi:hypothetical protein
VLNAVQFHATLYCSRHWHVLQQWGIINYKGVGEQALLLRGLHVCKHCMHQSRIVTQQVAVIVIGMGSVRAIAAATTWCVGVAYNVVVLPKTAE